jgi:purine operon repressor
MYAPKNSMNRQSNVLIIDDFMRAGGTIQGMMSLVEELESNVIGIGVLFEEVMEQPKLVDDYFSIFTIDPRKTTGHVTIQSNILK